MVYEIKTVILSLNFLHTAYTYVHEQCVKISSNLEMVTRKIFGHLAHFKWNDPIIVPELVIHIKPS